VPHHAALMNRCPADYKEAETSPLKSPWLPTLALTRLEMVSTKQVAVVSRSLFVFDHHNLAVFAGEAPRTFSALAPGLIDDATAAMMSAPSFNPERERRE